MQRLALLVLLFLPLGVAASDLEQQRKSFRSALAAAEAGRWSAVEALLPGLEGYPLVPDLRAAWLREQMGSVPDAELREFLAVHPDLGFSPSLRYQWAISLARRGEWRSYLDLYEASYRETGDTVLHCHALTARLRLGQTEGLEDQALRLWMSPVSQPAECDPPFDWLAARGALDSEQRQRRIALALDAGQFSLARWLARPLGEATEAQVERWERMRADPATRLRAAGDWQDTQADRALVLFGFHRLSSSDPGRAARAWPGFRNQFSFTAGERLGMDRRIALIHAWRHLPAGRGLLEGLPEEAHADDSREWTVRVLLREQDWEAALAALDALDPVRQREPAWQYWRARLLELTGEPEAAQSLYAGLAGERGFYSFMSADRIGADYSWRHRITEPRDEILSALESRNELLRARELYFVGQESRARSEWQRATTTLSEDERAQASILASRWGWYSRAIATASASGLEDDLDLRFPLPWRPVFEERSRTAGIRSAWAYGVARSESLFMPDVTSSAGAVGLMQLMPATGRRTAGEAGIRWAGHGTLTDPEKNVTLGTTYLSSMFRRFGQHEVLATAAYNAGPHRVDGWLPGTGPLPADVWVESVPFSETRGYVQRVLASDAVFQWRMSGETRRLAEAMRPVPPRRDSGAGGP